MGGSFGGGPVLSDEVFHTHDVDGGEVGLGARFHNHIHGLAAVMAENPQDREQHQGATVHARRAMKQDFGVRVYKGFQGELNTLSEQVRRLRQEVVLTPVPQDLDTGAVGDGVVVELALHVDDMGDARPGERAHVFGCADRAAHRQLAGDKLIVNHDLPAPFQAHSSDSERGCLTSLTSTIQRKNGAEQRGFPLETGKAR